MKIIIDKFSQFRINARNTHEVRQACPGNALGGSKMQQQFFLARGANARNAVQWGLADGLHAPRAVAADYKAV